MRIPAGVCAIGYRELSTLVGPNGCRISGPIPLAGKGRREEERQDAFDSRETRHTYLRPEKSQCRRVSSGQLIAWAAVRPASGGAGSCDTAILPGRVSYRVRPGPMLCRITSVNDDARRDSAPANHQAGVTDLTQQSTTLGGARLFPLTDLRAPFMGARAAATPRASVGPSRYRTSASSTSAASRPPCGCELR
jgi:hypothetical protein